MAIEDFMRHPRLLGIVLAVVFASYGTSAFACSCMAFPTDDAEAVALAWPRADAVFVGRVSAIEPGTPGLNRWTMVTFKVSEAWKGIDGDSPVVVRTGSTSAACGYPFRNGENYVVFANRRPQSGDLTTSLCGLNRPERNAENLKRELDRAKSAEAATR